MIEQEIRTQAEAAKAASYALAALRTDVRNAALEAMADALMEHTDAILHENAADVSEAKEAGMRASYIDRLPLDAERVGRGASPDGGAAGSSRQRRLLRASSEWSRDSAYACAARRDRHDL